MKNIFTSTVTVLLLIPSLVFAQEKVDTAMMQKIKEEEKQHSQIEMIAHNITDVCGPRLTNSPGYKRAVAWTSQTLKQWGLQNAGAEAWGEFGKGWSTEESYVAMKEPYYQPIIGYPVAWTNGTKKEVFAQVVLLDKLDSANIVKMGKDLKGKIVMIKSSDKIRDAFKPYAKRYEDSVLDKLPDAYMLTKPMLDFYIPIIMKGYNARLYLQSQGAVALLTEKGMGRDGTLFVDGMPS